MTASARLAAAVPRNTSMNHGLMTVRLMDCMAAIPSPCGMRASAFMMKVEKAKNTPAIKAQPSAVSSVRTGRTSSTEAPVEDNRGRGRHAEDEKKNRQLRRQGIAGPANAEPHVEPGDDEPDRHIGDGRQAYGLRIDR